MPCRAGPLWHCARVEFPKAKTLIFRYVKSLQSIWYLSEIRPPPWLPSCGSLSHLIVFKCFLWGSSLSLGHIFLFLHTSLHVEFSVGELNTELWAEWAEWGWVKGRDLHCIRKLWKGFSIFLCSKIALFCFYSAFGNVLAPWADLLYSAVCLSGWHWGSCTWSPGAPSAFC